MAKYSCRFLNNDGRIDDVEIIDCDGDKLAQARSSLFFSQRDFPAAELWLDGRLVHRYEKTPASSAT
jgi:hypothetical protein